PDGDQQAGRPFRHYAAPPDDPTNSSHRPGEHPRVLARWGHHRGALTLPPSSRVTGKKAPAASSALMAYQRRARPEFYV
ncbi:hypothetical protein, partial [Kineosporia mesophila]|uniref:hypothetical protein n=1 Tax=Kineosporia mesophila TaxID=566012 RepID=UPI0031E78F1B